MVDKITRLRQSDSRWSRKKDTVELPRQSLRNLSGRDLGRDKENSATQKRDWEILINSAAALETGERK